MARCARGSAHVAREGELQAPGLCSQQGHAILRLCMACRCTCVGVLSGDLQAPGLCSQQEHTILRLCMACRCTCVSVLSGDLQAPGLCSQQEHTILRLCMACRCTCVSVLSGDTQYCACAWHAGALASVSSQVTSAEPVGGHAASEQYLCVINTVSARAPSQPCMPVCAHTAPPRVCAHERRLAALAHAQQAHARCLNSYALVQAPVHKHARRQLRMCAHARTHTHACECAVRPRCARHWSHPPWPPACCRSSRCVGPPSPQS